MDKIHDKKHALKQPPVVKLAYFTAMCERFGYYVLAFLIVLYAKSALGFSDLAAFTLYGVFTALAYLVNPIGSYLADNVLGIRRCLLLGMFLEGVGLMLLACPKKSIFALGLGLVIIGVGIFKTAPTHLMGRSYHENDPRIDGGFTYYYMWLCVGGLMASIFISFVQQILGWSISFLVGGIGVFIGFIFYYIFRKRAVEFDSEAGRRPLKYSIKFLTLFGLIIGVLASAFLVLHTHLANFFFVIAALTLFIYFAYEIIQSPHAERLRIIACLSLIIIAFVFFVMYHQLFTSIVLFINRCVYRQFLGFEIPTVMFFSFNPILAIILGPVLVAIYNYFAKKGYDFHITLKFSLGLLFASLTFFALSLCGLFANIVGQVSIWWTVLVFFLITLGEMLISALGVAMVTQIAPKRMYGVMMGTWFLVSLSLSAAMSGLLAGFASIPDTIQDSSIILGLYKIAFLKFGIVSLIFTAISFIVSPYLKRIARIVKVD